jgi:hypothetical protein
MAVLLGAMGVVFLVSVAAPPILIDIPGAHTPSEWEQALFAVTCFVLGVGFWRALDWSRRAAIVFGVGYFLYHLVLCTILFRERIKTPHHSVLGMGLTVAIALSAPVGVVVYSTRATTRKQFVGARSA